jgi:hypothetical protein
MRMACVLEYYKIKNDLCVAKDRGFIIKTDITILHAYLYFNLFFHLFFHLLFHLLNINMG